MAENNDEEDFLITKQDWVSLGTGERFCARGVRALCASYGFSYQDFLENGVMYSRIKHIKNAMLHRVVEIARERHNREKNS